jgi:hypothetical protein
VIADLLFRTLATFISPTYLAFNQTIAFEITVSFSLFLSFFVWACVFVSTSLLCWDVVRKYSDIAQRLVTLPPTSPKFLFFNGYACREPCRVPLSSMQLVKCLLALTLLLYVYNGAVVVEAYFYCSSCMFISKVWLCSSRDSHTYSFS